MQRSKVHAAPFKVAGCSRVPFRYARFERQTKSCNFHAGHARSTLARKTWTDGLHHDFPVTATAEKCRIPDSHTLELMPQGGQPYRPRHCQTAAM
jgi:hypothetical protein